MTFQIAFKAVGNIFALRYQSDIARSVFDDLVDKQRIMGTSQNDGVYLGVFS